MTSIGGIDKTDTKRSKRNGRGNTGVGVIVMTEETTAARGGVTKGTRVITRGTVCVRYKCTVDEMTIDDFGNYVLLIIYG